MPVRSSTKQDLLRAVPLFSHCSKREISEIAAECDEIAVREGTELTRQGGSGREFVIMVEGAADVVRDGRTVNRLGPSDFLGEIALLGDIPRTATVTTTEPSVLLVLTDRAFARLTKRVPAVHEKLLRALAERFQDSAV